MAGEVLYRNNGERYKMPLITVFTPAYNRAYTLGRTYESLCRQTSKDFKWIIVDDGSTDNTEAMVKPWLDADNGFVIEYYKKENGGMHTAHNEAYKHIDTELAVCIDSDDWMPDNGVELIINKWRRDGNERFAGMIGLDIFENGNVVGTCFPDGLHHCKTYEMRPKYRVFCDKKYVYRPDVIKQYLPYVAYPGERYGTVNYLYQVIDHDYDMLCGNEVYCIVEYQPDGLSANSYNQLKQSPRTRMAENNINMKYQGYFKIRFKAAVQYVACAIICKDKDFFVNASNKCLVALAIPFGLLGYLYLKNKGLKKIG